MALLALTAPDPPRGAAEQHIQPTIREPLWITLQGFFRNSAYVGTVLGYAAYTFGLGGLAFWMPKYLEQVRGMELSRANYVVGAVTVLAGLIGTFVGGYLGDSIARRVKHGQLWLCGISSLAAIVPTWLTLAPVAPGSYLTWFFIAEFLLFLSTGPVNVAIVSVVPVGARAMAMAVSIFSIHVLGDAISPPIIGLLGDMAGLARAVLIVPAAIAISGLVWSVTARFS
jgi:MFS family permease